ncbi:MAG: efflux RND transporter periplasmic adaptor subunit [Isosphaeraceae bacterium]|nr:efflux RND transporter periplasmic adaptor subunit [Isosphaeraceae bacterium]
MEIFVEPSTQTDAPRPIGISAVLANKRLIGGSAVVVCLSALTAAGWWPFAGARIRHESRAQNKRPATAAAPASEAAEQEDRPASVRLSEEQQKAIGLKTVKVTSGSSYDVLTAPGRIAPNETQYAYITPRAAGVVRSVTAHVGQDVKAGDLLATIDSPEVGDGRLELYTRLQTLDVARAQADWQETIFRNTLELVERLRKGQTPDQIHEAFADKALGENREKLMTAYAQYRLAAATIERNRDLFAQKLITPKQFEQVNADYDVARATYQSLMDQMGYGARLANVRAQQAKDQAETAVRAAQERLRILGVKPDGTEPEVAGGKVIGVNPDGTLSGPGSDALPATVKPETILPREGSKRHAVVQPVGAAPEPGEKSKDSPVSSYSIWAPFDGTILDREMIVPGVAVDKTHRIFTMANLSSVWVEANVHESDFRMLVRSRGGKVRFRSPAYPDRVFEGEVIYTGDLVDEASRTVKLLARAQNPDRALKPGMFVAVEVFSPDDKSGPQVPLSALLTHGSRTFVYVRTGPDRFARREIETSVPHGDRVTVRAGLESGEEVVAEGAFKLKALAAQTAGAER